MQLINSFLPATQSEIDFFLKGMEWPTLPDDYRTFLETTNGGFANKDNIEIDTTIPFYMQDGTKLTETRPDTFTQLYGIRREFGPERNYPRALDINKITKLQNFLPRKVVAIGEFLSKSLICLDLNQEHFGKIYYWDYYWQEYFAYPHYKTRLEEATGSIEDKERIKKNPRSEEYDKVGDKLNYIILTEIASNFNDLTSKIS